MARVGSKIMTKRMELECTSNALKHGVIFLQSTLNGIWYRIDNTLQFTDPTGVHWEHELLTGDCCFCSFASTDLTLCRDCNISRSSFLVFLSPSQHWRAQLPTYLQTIGMAYLHISGVDVPMSHTLPSFVQAEQPSRPHLTRWDKNITKSNNSNNLHRT